MNVNKELTRNYEKRTLGEHGKNEPKTNPIKANFQRAQMNVNSLITKDYRKKDDFAVRKNKPNSNPISSKAKMNVNFFSTKDYENKSNWALGENKPNQTRSGAEIPTGELLGILKPGTNPPTPGSFN